MKNIILLIFILSISSYSQDVKIEASFYISDELIEDAKFFLLENNIAKLLKYEFGYLYIKNQKDDYIKVLLSYKNYKAEFYLTEYRESKILKVYCEDNIFNRKRIKFRLKQLFRKPYMIERGFDYVSIVLQSRKKYCFL